MELEFDVKMTAGILYDYMLRHTYNSASGLLGTMVGALMIVYAGMKGGVLLMIAGIVVLAYLPWTLFLKSKQQMMNTSAFKQPLHYKMTQEGIEVSQGEVVQTQKWEDMYKAVSTQRSIIVYTSKVSASVFPREALGEQTAAVVEMISTHMPPAKVKIRW